MSWTTGPGQTQNNWMSFQYNPDWDTSKYQQHESCCAVTDDWFQTAIIDQKPTVSDPNCVLLTIQVYDTSLDSVDNAANLDGRADFPSASSCYTVSDILSAGSTWYIDELVDSGQDRIVEVLYGVSPGTGGTGLQYSLFPPYSDYWFWLRSNICWCGVSGYADPHFTSAYGTNALHSDKNLWSIDPPIDLATAENSNMPYTQFTGAGTTSMSQMFGWAPSGGGGGGGGGGCVRTHPHTMDLHPLLRLLTRNSLQRSGPEGSFFILNFSELPAQ